MFDNTVHYTLRADLAEGITRYYVSFIDGQAIYRETEVSRPVYLELLRFIKVERNLRRWDERHTEQSDLTDALHNRGFCPQKSVEETTFESLQNEQLRFAVQSLSEIQRRRFSLYYEFGLTYEQIAKVEGCSSQAIAKAVKGAKIKIKNYFENQG